MRGRGVLTPAKSLPRCSWQEGVQGVGAVIEVLLLSSSYTCNSRTHFLFRGPFLRHIQELWESVADLKASAMVAVVKFDLHTLGPSPSLPLPAGPAADLWKEL